MSLPGVHVVCVSVWCVTVSVCACTHGVCERECVCVVHVCGVCVWCVWCVCERVVWRVTVRICARGV